MQYISPLSFLEGAGAIAGDKKGIVLAKKKMLAELELAGGNTIVVNGRELTKNDIIVFFDSLIEDDTLPYHVAIADDAVLLGFLENNHLARNARFKTNPLFNDRAFIEWLSPFFFTSFASIAKKCLKEKNDDMWFALLLNPLLMNGYYAERAWKEVEQHIKADWATLNLFQKSKALPGLGTVEHLVNFRYTSMLGRLPHSRFDTLLDQYAFTLMQCSVHIFNKISRGKGLIIVQNALLLAVSPHIKDAIALKGVEMESIDKTVRNKKRDQLAWRIAAALVFVFFFFTAIFSSISNDADKQSSPYDSIKFFPKDTFAAGDTIGYFGHSKHKKDSTPAIQLQPPPKQDVVDTSNTTKPLKARSPKPKN